MGVITYDMEITSSIPPAKMFKAFVLDSDNLIPKILPQAIKSVEINQGDGGAGTIKLITFGEGQFLSSSLITSFEHHYVKFYKAAGMFKAVEAYHLANPDAYN